ncbi:MAG TPA: ATP-dependent helicase [Saprospiraceae bacterium]|nr:ATP-dependent helicase [Saprospiraceae bacterium]
MLSKLLSIEHLWKLRNFQPNDSQQDAILYTDGPLFLTAGPGSGKTRVLLWRTLNLLVFHGVKPEDILLSTFTEKAALQLKDGLRTLLGVVTNETGQPFDISKMALGTVHSICQSIITDRRFSQGGARKHPPLLMDALSQYFKLYNRRYWTQLCLAGGFADENTAILEINGYFGNSSAQYGPSQSRHTAVTEVISVFNRFSEESLNPDTCQTSDATLTKMLRMYRAYLYDLNSHPLIKQVDFSLLQKLAHDQIISLEEAASVYKHVIIDEYQDTNAIQEKIFFSLAKGNKNICVVGDDDQALYRFRGATVENLVEFEDRCLNAIGVKPKRIDLDINYRSRKGIVDTYTGFINIADWKKDKPLSGHYRIHDKNIKAHSTDTQTSVVASSHTRADNVYRELAEFVYQLKLNGKIEDYSQCAFLFPAMKNNVRVDGFRRAFEAVNEDFHLIGTPNELKIYAPRAGRFLEVDEARAIWGLMLLIFERPHYGQTQNRSLIEFRQWMFDCIGFATHLCNEDTLLKQYVADRKADLALIAKDYEILLKVTSKAKLNIKDAFKYSMIRTFAEASGLSAKGKKNLSNKFFTDIVRKRELEGNPFTIEYIINRSTSVDWSVLDLFYQLNGFRHFRDMYALAQNGLDEGPVCNLGLITQYISRFMEEYSPVITASYMSEDKFSHSLFSSYTYALYRLGEAEYEDAEDPFPKGRISFLTIHQSKGLEFPVVVLGSVDKRERAADQKELIVRELLEKEGEPLEKISKFDNMRMFYVALSRAKNLLVLPRITTTRSENSVPRPDQLYATDEFKTLFTSNSLTAIPDFDINTLPSAAFEKEDLGKSYSYTADYLQYVKCPRQYMIMRKYGFVASRSQTMLFGSLVHQTIEDLHHLLINERKTAATV